MSKRFKVRQRTAAKKERSLEVIDQFYGNVIAELERLKAMPTVERDRLEKALAATEAAP